LFIFSEKGYIGLFTLRSVGFEYGSNDSFLDLDYATCTGLV